MDLRFVSQGFLWGIGLLSRSVLAQQPDSDTLRTAELREVVVTATRSERNLAALPLPVSVVTAKQIRAMGSLRLSDVLAEQTGLVLTHDHGTGVQVQGFSPEYTLILVDGEPLVGRTAGTLDLTRLAVGNIRQIEIVKGPSSSLYGSEALAGVINIVTENPGTPRADFTARYGTNRTSDLAANAGFRHGPLGLKLFANRYASGGYDLTPGVFGATVAPFATYTLAPKLTYALAPGTRLVVSTRFFGETQQQASELADGARLRGAGRVRESTVNPTLSHRFGQHVLLTARLYATRYRTDAQLDYADGQPYDVTRFDQSFRRVEAQGEWLASRRQTLTFGAGRVWEAVEATRYADRKRFQTSYAFTQWEWAATDRLQLIAGGRYDAHSAYADQFSPKVSAAYRLGDGLTLRGAVGVGFKAPDFRQLYLNFGNAVVGYTVLGSQELLVELARLTDQGQLSDRLLDPAAFGELRPERSLAANFGGKWTLKNGLSLQLNGFRNEVRDLIETQAVARKTNGQNVFSYRNLARVFTQGLEVEGNKQFSIPDFQFSISAGYQLLEARDRDVLDRLRAGTVYRRDPETLVTTRVPVRDYGGLLNRSRHSANVRLFVEHPKTGFSATVRGIFRSRFGFADRNANAILDAPDEYVPGYGVWNLSAARTFGARVRLQAGVDNLLGYIHPDAIPNLPGRLVWLSAGLSLRGRTPTP
jgi:outer membrane receptor for ferrienterochelin and colicins